MTTCAHRKTKVQETRTLSATVYRRRLCLACDAKFVTIELARPGLTMPARRPRAARPLVQPAPAPRSVRKAANDEHSPHEFDARGTELAQVWK